MYAIHWIVERMVEGLRLLASIRARIRLCLLTFRVGGVECLSDGRGEWKGGREEEGWVTRQKFSFALRLDVSIPRSPSLRLSRVVILVGDKRDISLRPVSSNHTAWAT